MKTNLERFLEHCKDVDIETRIRSRILTLSILISIGAFFTAGVYHFIYGNAIYIHNVTTILILGAIFYLFYRFKNVNLFGNLFMATIWGYLAINVQIRGGIDSPALIWACFLPISGGIVLNLSWGIAWSSVYASSVLTLYFLQNHGWQFTDILPPNESRTLKIFAYIWVLFFCFLLQLYFKKITSRYRLELEKERNDTRTLLRVLCHDLTPSLEILERFIARQNTLSTDIDARAYTSAKTALINIQDIVSQTRDWQKAGSSSQTEALVPVKVNSIVHALFGKYILQLQAKNIQFEFEKGSGLGLSILAEPLHLIQQVFGNLMSNSIKFTPNGGKIIFRAVKSRNHVHLILADTGVGMPSGWETSFSFGNRILRSGTEGETGTGFGLPIAICYVERLGGTLRIRSTEVNLGKKCHGTIVRVTLPAVLDSVPAQQKSPKALFLKILVIDDSRIYHELTKDLLFKMYCICRTEKDASSALHALQEERFDAIFVDAYLANESGYLLAKQIRGDSHHAKAKVYYFSASVPSKNERPLSFDQVYDGYVLKPLDWVQLESILLPLRSDPTPKVFR